MNHYCDMNGNHHMNHHHYLHNPPFLGIWYHTLKKKIILSQHTVDLWTSLNAVATETKQRICTPHVLMGFIIKCLYLPFCLICWRCVLFQLYYCTTRQLTDLTSFAFELGLYPIHDHFSEKSKCFEHFFEWPMYVLFWFHRHVSIQTHMQWLVHMCNFWLDSLLSLMQT